MRKVLTITFCAVVVLALSAVTVGAGDGKTLFMDNKCNTCHSVSKAGIEAKVKSGAMAGGDLSANAAELDAEWAVKFLKKEAQKEGADHKKPFKGSDEDLKAIVAWLKEQQS